MSILLSKRIKQAYSIQEMLTWTNYRLAQWYEQVKTDYNIEGTAIAIHSADTNEVIINYTENGKSHIWSMAFYPEYCIEQKIDYVFMCWSELA